MSIFDPFKNEQTGHKPSEAPKDFRLTAEQVEAIVGRINEQTRRKALRLRVEPDRRPSLFDSKFGGLPYWDDSMEYPEDIMGEKLVLLAQINLEDAGGHSLLPRSGLLQFFVRQDEVYGCTFDDGTGADSYCVVWHETIDRTVTPEAVREMGIPSSEDELGCEVPLPVSRELAVSIEQAEVPMGMEDYRFEELFRKAAAELGIELPEKKHLFMMIPDEWDSEYPNPNEGHWMLGYPYFIQFDPRGGDDMSGFDIQLLQIDSEYGKGLGYEIMWGDAGVCNFFISSEALEERDFSRVMYTWDCG